MYNQYCAMVNGDHRDWFSTQMKYVKDVLCYSDTVFRIHNSKKVEVVENEAYWGYFYVIFSIHRQCSVFS